jgi:demethoxyubiquinone hydroxylase (CLK1/Coq7/Cat5 family)
MRDGWQRFRLLATLRWNRLGRIGAVEVYRVQRGAASDANVNGLLWKLGLEGADQAEDLATLIRRHGGRPLVPAGFTTGIGWVLGSLSVVLGTRASLRLDRWMEERGVRLYERAIALLPPEEGISARALQAMQGQGMQHLRLLREHLDAMRAAARVRR